MNATTEMVGYSHNAGSPRAELVGVFDDGDVGAEDARERRHRHFRALLLGMSRARRAAFVACWRASRPPARVGCVVGYGPEDVGAMTEAQKRAFVKAYMKKKAPWIGSGVFGKTGARGLVKIARVAAVGLTFVAPPLGAGAVMALSAADKVLEASEGHQGKAKQAAATRLLANTATAARAGHLGARLGLRSIVIAKRERARRPPELRGVAGTGTLQGVLVLRDGTIVRGHYRKA
jgi:hypothetical protein